MYSTRPLNRTLGDKKDVNVMRTQVECNICEILKSVMDLFEAVKDNLKPVHVIWSHDKDVANQKAVSLFEMKNTPVLIAYRKGAFDKILLDQVTHALLMECVEL
ncbi:putative thioredoxin-like protein [Staphylococcus phage vB_SauH_DELF3]|nr:putative thioredoxin-like protein [Staphylococcus phage vB_SauH_DELF3]